ncbi:IS701 family transposase, partial [Geobacillus sp. G4]
MIRIDVSSNHSQGGSCLMNRLAHHQGIHKFFTMLGLALYFSKPVMKHLVHIVDAMITKG